MYKYYQLIKNSKGLIPYRKEIIKYVIDHENKLESGNFKITSKTVRKWRSRFENKKPLGLKNKSNKSKLSPNEIKPYDVATYLISVGMN